VTNVAASTSLTLVPPPMIIDGKDERCRRVNVSVCFARLTAGIFGDVANTTKRHSHAASVQP
jgi:hypothetical protein